MTAAILYNHEATLTRKIKLLNEYLLNLKSTLEELADETDEWNHNIFVTTLETSNKDYSKMHLQYQEWMTGFRDAIEKPQKT